MARQEDLFFKRANLEQKIAVLMRISGECTAHEKEVINPFIERYQNEYITLTGFAYEPQAQTDSKKASRYFTRIVIN